MELPRRTVLLKKDKVSFNKKNKHKKNSSTPVKIQRKAVSRDRNPQKTLLDLEHQVQEENLV